jgi:hypothetical protein
MDTLVLLKRSIRMETAVKYGSINAAITDLAKECKDCDEFRDCVIPYMSNDEVRAAVEQIYSDFTGFKDTDLRLLYEIIKANGGEII